MILGIDASWTTITLLALADSYENFLERAPIGPMPHLEELCAKAFQYSADPIQIITAYGDETSAIWAPSKLSSDLALKWKERVENIVMAEVELYETVNDYIRDRVICKKTKVYSNEYKELPENFQKK